MKKIILVLFIFMGFRTFSQNDPSIELTFIPEWGYTDLLQGKVHNTNISDHGVAVYIFAEEAGGWWTKPTFAEPVTMIQPDSTFTTNIVTGGIDQYATRIIAFLIPLSSLPPILSGMELPDSMFSFPYEVSCRPHGERVISWSGYDWVVKKSVGDPLISMGPGPNIFSDQDTMVWIDGQQRLHLRIAKTGSSWHCSEVICKSSEGYRRYEFEVGSRIDLLDPNVINGIFTWDDCSPFAQPPNDFFREIDIEFSRWGNPNNDNSQFVIQPWDIPGNINRFNMNLTGVDYSTHSFDWKPDSIVFTSTWGNSTHSWKYTNPVYFPEPGKENIRINLWLMSGLTPLNNMNAEVILNSLITDIPENIFTNKNVKVYPNPMNNGCQIEIQSDISTDAEIVIIDLYGNIVRSVFTGKIAPGSNKIYWDGNTELRQPVPRGLYFIYYWDKNDTRHFKIVKL